MSYVLSVICVEPMDEAEMPSGFLAIQPAAQDPSSACYLPGLSRCMGYEVRGHCYYIFADIGRRFPSSRPFFRELREPVVGAGRVPPILAIPTEFRPEFDELLQRLLTSSGLRRVIVLCELNGNVTWSNPNRR